MAKGNISSLTEKQLEQILAKAPKYVVKDGERDRRDLGLNPTVNEVYLVLRTLIKDLKKAGILR